MRFKEFSGEWEKIRLGSIIEEIKNYTSDFNKYPLYSFTIENGVTPKTDRYERNFLVTKDGDTFKIVPPNSFVMNPMNLRFGAINYSKVKIPVSVSGYYNIFEIENGKNNEFWSAYFLTKTAINLYNSVATGSLIEKKRVHFSQFIQLSFFVPSDVEKQKITRFLQLIENRIAVQNKIISDLKVLKKELCNKLFNSSHCDKTIEIRQVADIYGGYAFNSKAYISDGKYKIVTIGNVTGDKYISGDYNRIDILPDNIQEQQILNNGDILISLTGNVGRISIVNGDNYLLNQRVAKLNIKNNLIKAYIYQYLSNSSFEKDMSNAGQGAAQKNIKNEDILSYNIRIPTSQTYLEKIDGLLSSYDKLIADEERFLLNLNLQKSFLLNAMFI